MKIKYLGTAAAEGIPTIFCECTNCREAMKRGGRDIRTRSQAIIDDCLLVDFPADTYMHFLQHKIPLSRVKSCLITHSHMDHLQTADLRMRKKGFSHIKDIDVLTFYSDKSAYDMIAAEIELSAIPEDIVQNVLISPYVPFEVEGYRVTAVRATHDPKSTPVVYLIEKDGKVLFYVNDTSDFGEEAWAFLESYGKHVDLISYDCTEANLPISYIGHMNLERCVAMRARLEKIGMSDENTISVLNHFTHNGRQVLYDEFVSLATRENFVVAYDGLEIEF